MVKIDARDDLMSLWMPTREPDAEIELTELARAVLGATVVTLTTHKQRLAFLQRGLRLLDKLEDEPLRDAGFDAFYAAYPRREARAAASRAWKALCPGPALVQRIMEAVHQQYGGGVLREDLIFVPLPGTWLRDERWTDEPMIPSTSF